MSEMYLTKATAREIIKEISSVIDYDLNLIDNKGTIIASTDEDHVSTHTTRPRTCLSGTV